MPLSTGGASDSATASASKAAGGANEDCYGARFAFFVEEKSLLDNLACAVAQAERLKTLSPVPAGLQELEVHIRGLVGC
eukprot:13644623-Alexandrium_andersonii.AAC.1